MTDLQSLQEISESIPGENADNAAIPLQLLIGFMNLKYGHHPWMSSFLSPPTFSKALVSIFFNLSQ
jgi:hypothetical protein